MKTNTVEKIAEQAIMKEGGFTSYLELINKVTDKEAFALAIKTLDNSVTKGGFREWRVKGFSHSKRASRVMNKFLAKIDTNEANAVLKAKKSYTYSISEKQNYASTDAYKAVRKSFLNQVDKFLAA